MRRCNDFAFRHTQRASASAASSLAAVFQVDGEVALGLAQHLREGRERLGLAIEHRPRLHQRVVAQATVIPISAGCSLAVFHRDVQARLCHGRDQDRPTRLDRR